MTRATQITAALADALRAQPGWAMAVTVGRPAREQTVTPVLALVPLSDRVEAESGHSAKCVREYQVEVLLDDSAGAPADADTALLSIRRALASDSPRPLGGLALSIEQGEASFEYPPDGSSLMRLVVIVAVTYTEQIN